MKVIDFCPCCGSTAIEKTYGFIAPFLTTRIFGWPATSRFEPVLRRLGLSCPSWLRKQLSKRLVHMQTGVCICQECRFVCSDVRFDDDEMARYYVDFMGPTYTAQRVLVEPEFASIRPHIYSPDEFLRRAAYMSEFLSRHLSDVFPSVKRVLDYGGGDGSAIPRPLFEQAQVFVFDISDKPVKEGVKRVDSLDDLPRFDFALCCHVLEHVPFPNRIIDQIFAVLEPDSWLYVEVPKEIPERVRQAQSLSGLIFHEHINHFHEQSVKALLERCGFEVAISEPFPADIGWIKGTFIRALARKPAESLATRQ